MLTCSLFFTHLFLVIFDPFRIGIGKGVVGQDDDEGEVEGPCVTVLL